MHHPRTWQGETRPNFLFVVRRMRGKTHTSRVIRPGSNFITRDNSAARKIHHRLHDKGGLTLSRR